MKIVIEFAMDNAAFENAPEAEAAEILRVVANRILFGATSGKCKDHNGNPVGKWEIVCDLTDDELTRERAHECGR